MSRKFLVPLVLPADPAAAMEAATKQYVDGIVVVAAADPIAANPSAELWVDTTTPPGSVSIPASYPRGYITHISSSSNVSVTTPAAWTGLMSVTFTADPTRRYKYTAWALVRKDTAAGDAYISIATASGATNPLNQAGGYAPVNSVVPLSTVAIETGISGTVTRWLNAYVVNNGGTYFGQVGAVMVLLVEDIGGV